MSSNEETNSRESRRGFRDARYVRVGDANPAGCSSAGAASSSGSQLRRELPVLPELTEEETKVFGTVERTYRLFSLLDELMVRVNGEDMPPYLEGGFVQCSLHDALRQNMRKAGIFWPSPVQRYAIPGLLAGRDLYVVSETGAGKIASFVLPMVQLVLAQEVLELTAPQPYVIIVTPTRKTTAKTYAEARKLAYGTPVRVCMVDSTFEGQQREIARGCHILVATPGWLTHLRHTGTVAFRNVKAVVLHDVDQIIQLGLTSAVEFLLNDPTLPAKEHRQTVFYTLTIHGPVHDLAVNFMTRPIIVILSGTSRDIRQTIHRVEQSDKRSKLGEILRRGNTRSTLVFVLDRQRAESLAAHLSADLKIPAAVVVGGMSYADQQKILSDLKAGLKRVVVATPDAIAGPLVIPIYHVINYDMPRSITEYVRRIAQTGRVDLKGRATSFYDPRTDSALASDLRAILFECQQHLPDFLTDTKPSDPVGSSIAGASGLTVQVANFADEQRETKNEDKWEVSDDDDELIDVVN